VEADPALWLLPTLIQPKRKLLACPQPISKIQTDMDSLQTLDISEYLSGVSFVTILGKGDASIAIVFHPTHSQSNRQAFIPRYTQAA
jgi:hypothetical protein